jgi:hypothetical protein
MFEGLLGAYGGRLVIAVLGVGLALLCLIGILWIVRGRRGPSPFVRGGRNRQPRLQVLDAAAVDTRRRLVLVRRDDVEHLIMIGGPTDIVVESRIAPSGRPQPDGQVAESPLTAPAAFETPVARPVASPPKPIAQQPTPRAEPVRQVPTDPRAVEHALRQTAGQGTALPASQSHASAAVPLAAAPAALRPQPVAPEASSHVQATAAIPPARPASSSQNVSTPAAQAPDLSDAVHLLDTARDRVFADKTATEPAKVAALPTAASQRPAAPTGEHSKALGSDFEKILEEEMANNIAAREDALAARGNRIPTAAGANTQLPGATKSEPTLQTEVARIFGEMSASRDR